MTSPGWTLMQKLHIYANPHFPVVPDAIMGYEDSVYLAKLAEQAERYEGKASFHQALDKILTSYSLQRWSRT